MFLAEPFIVKQRKNQDPVLGQGTNGYNRASNQVAKLENNLKYLICGDIVQGSRGTVFKVKRAWIRIRHPEQGFQRIYLDPVPAGLTFTVKEKRKEQNDRKAYYRQYNKDRPRVWKAIKRRLEKG